MPGGVYVGRRRPIWHIILFQFLTLGVYGRVWLYRTARELDGHDALFLDRRLYLLGVLLPVGGPLAVKWRLVTLVRDATRHDPTSPPMHPTYLKAAAFVPLLPVLHSLLQRHLKHHWTLHRKLNDIEARRDVLELRRAAARSAEERAEVQRLDEDLHQRESVLAQAREAAVSIREAQRARARAEAEIRSAGGGPSRIEQLRQAAMKPIKRRLERQDEASLPPSSEPSSVEPETPIREAVPKPRMGRPREPPSEPTPSADATSTAVAPALDESTMSRRERKLYAALNAARAKREEKEAKERAKRDAKAAKSAEKRGEPAPPPETPGVGTPSKKEIKLGEKLDRARAKREQKDAAAGGATENAPTASIVDAQPEKPSRFSFGRRKSTAAPMEPDAIVIPPGSESSQKRSFFRRRRPMADAETPAQPDAVPAVPEPAPEPAPTPEAEPERAQKKPAPKRSKPSPKRSSGR